MNFLGTISHLLIKIAGKLRYLETRRSNKVNFKSYLSGIGGDHKFSTFSKSIQGDMSASASERFSHYDAFAYFTHKRVRDISKNRLKILDLGSVKLSTALLSLNHDVTSLVLVDPNDEISQTNYLVHDASLPLPFENSSFDIFTSTVSVHLIGLGRYGDIIDPNAIPNLIGELDRVLKPNSDLFISLALGKNALKYNVHWEFELETIKSLFEKWALEDHLIDIRSSQFNLEGPRFTKEIPAGINQGANHVIFLHFKR